MNKLPFFKNQPYQKYSPNVFDDSLSLYEQIIAFIEFLNKSIQNSNDMVDFINLTKEQQDAVIKEMKERLSEFLNDFDYNLIRELSDLLKEWQQDGTIEIIINEALESKISKLDEQIEQNKKRFVNISLDDFCLGFIDLINNPSYTSIFDSAVFKQLKTYHDMYGVKFSLFVFTHQGYDIKDVPDKFKNEFLLHKDWMRFGYHGKNNSSDYATASLSSFKLEYDYFLQHIERITGYNDVLKTVRLHSYSGNNDIINSLINDYSVTGLMSADDSRISYNLTASESNQMNAVGVLTKNGINYYKTNVRLENVQLADVTTKLNYNVDNDYLVVFTHEYVLMTDATLSKLDRVFKWLHGNGYAYSFFEKFNEAEYLSVYKKTRDYVVELGTDWSVKSNSRLTVKFEKQFVFIQGQLEKTSVVLMNDTILTMPSGLRPPVAVTVDAHFYDATTAVSIPVIMQSTGQLQVGLRDKIRVANLTTASFTIMYYT